MSFGLDKPAKGLPLAFEPLYPLLQAARTVYSEQQEILKARRSFSSWTKSGPQLKLDTSLTGPEANAVDLELASLNSELEFHKKELRRTFSKFHEAQGAVGDFEIFEAEDLFSTIKTLDLAPVILYGPTPQIALEKILGQALRSPPTREFDSFFSHFSPIINASSHIFLWDVCKEFMIEAQAESGSSWTYNLRVILSELFKSRSITEETLSSASLELFSLSSLEQLDNFIEPLKEWIKALELCRLSHFGDSFKFRASPYFVKSLNPKFFETEIKRQSIDEEVVKMLLPSWSEDLGSLLEAAQSLSADQ